MISEKENEHCADFTSNRLAKASIWRDGLAARYPLEHRNLHAAKSMSELAIAFADLPDDAWVELKPF